MVKVIGRICGVVGTACLFAACGGGGGGGAAAGSGVGDGGGPSAGIDRGGVTSPTEISGAINAFGSVVIGGLRFDTGNALFTIDGDAGSERDLRIGEVVRLRGERGDGGDATAMRVELDHGVSGVVESIDLAGRRLTVLGQSVRVDGATSFDPAFSPRSLDGVAPGDGVAVSGFLDADGAWRATRIERSAGGELRLRGVVSNVDTAAARFDVNALTVDYGQSMLDRFASGAPEDGNFVQITGSRLEQGVLSADSVLRRERSPLAGRDDDADAEYDAVLQGFVTRFVDVGDFDVDGQAVAAGAQTIIVNGALADLALNSRLQVDGTIGSDGRLSADRIRFDRPGSVRIEAPVEAVDAAAGTLTVLGIDVHVDALTRMEDVSAAGVRVFGLAQLSPGDAVELRGFEDPSGSGRLVVTRLEREDDDDDDVEVVGPVASVDEPEFSIAGIRILTTAATEFDDVDRSAFFADGVGLAVEVEGTYSSGILTAEEVEPESE